VALLLVATTSRALHPVSITEAATGSLCLRQNTGLPQSSRARLGPAVTLRPHRADARMCGSAEKRMSWSAGLGCRRARGD
jgi:hypothetical protein